MQNNLIGQPEIRLKRRQPGSNAPDDVRKKIAVDREKLTAYLFDDADPERMNESLLDVFLNSAVANGASDISIKSDDLARVEISGVYYKATRRIWNMPEVDMIMNKIYGSTNARTEINAMKELDFAYEMTLDTGDRQRYRVNITGCLAAEDHGVEISMRVLPRITPSKESVGLSDEEIAAMMPRDGIVIVAGGTGHGKSTTLAAVTAEHLKSMKTPVKIIDIQAPIEYTFRDVLKETKASSSFIVQMGVGVNIKSFDAGVRASLRKKPQIISVGEARDSETIAASIEGSLTGHLVYTTTHADSIAATVQRLLSRFEGADRESKANDLCSSLRFIMVQALVERIDKPGRVPVREYLRITDRIREKMSTMAPSKWAQYLTDEVNGKITGTTSEDMRKSMREAAVEAYKKGMISKTVTLSLSRQIKWGDENG